MFLPINMLGFGFGEGRVVDLGVGLGGAFVKRISSRT